MGTTRMMMGKIHCAYVTDANLNYSGSVSVDLDLLEACGLLPNQEVEIWNVTNGERFSTYILPSDKPRGAGEITLNGSAARRVAIGDKVIICGYSEVDLQSLLVGGKEHISYCALIENTENKLRKQFRTVVRVLEEGDPIPEGALVVQYPYLKAGQKVIYDRQYLIGY